MSTPTPRADENNLYEQFCENPECRECSAPMRLNEDCEWPEDERLWLCSSCISEFAEKLLGKYEKSQSTVQQLERELADMTNQRDALAQSLAETWHGMDTIEHWNPAECRNQAKRLLSALAATKGGSQTLPCKDDLIDACNALLQSEEVQKAWPLDGIRKAEKPSDTFSKATATVKFRKLLAIHTALQAKKGGGL